MCRALLLFLSVFVIFISSCSERAQVKVERMDLVQGVYASGNIVPLNYYSVKPTVSGELEQILVEAGQIVNAGDPLLKIRNRPGELSLQTAKNQYELARENASEDSDILTQLRQEIANARVAYRQDSLEWLRFERLHAEDIGSEVDYERRQLQFETSRNTLNIAQRKWSETRERLRIEMENAYNNFLAQQSRTGDYTIISAIEGRIYNILPEEGELVTAGQTLMEIGSAQNFEAELQVDETDISLIRPGQPVFFDLDAIEDSLLSGEVTLMYPRVDPIERTARVMASLKPTRFELYPGMTLEANIVIQEKKSILVLPAGYVDELNQVVLKNGNNKKIQTGIRDLNYIEILSGLEEGEIILKPGS